MFRNRKSSLFIGFLIFALHISILSAPATQSANSYLVSTLSGVAGTSPERQLGQVHTASLAPDGNLFLADPQSFMVWKFKDGSLTSFVKMGKTWNGIRSQEPCGVFAKSNNEIYVSYCDFKSVDLFDGSGVLKRKYLVDVGLSDMGRDWGGGLTVNNQGDIFLSEEFNNVIIKVDSVSGLSEIFAGVPGSRGFNNGARRQATFNVPRGIVFDNQGSLLIADTLNRAVRKIDQNGSVSTLHTMSCNPMGVDKDSKGAIYVVGDRDCGALIQKIGTGDIVNDSRKSVNLSVPGAVYGEPEFTANSTIAIDRFGSSPKDDIYIADLWNGNIKKYSQSGKLLSTFGPPNGFGVTNLSDDKSNEIYYFPHKVFAIEDGSYLVVDNVTVRHLSSSGKVLKVTYLSQSCWWASGSAMSKDGTLFCSSGNKILVRFPDAQVSFIGNGIADHVDGDQNTSSFNGVSGMTFWQDDLYVVEHGWPGTGYIRKVSRDANSRNFRVSTILGTGKTGQIGEYMERQSAILQQPNHIAFDTKGTMFIGSGPYAVWKTTLAQNAPVTRMTGKLDGGWITGIVADEAGSAYVSTSFGSIFKGDSVLNQLTSEGIGSRNGSSAEAKFFTPMVSTIDKNGDLIIADRDNNSIRKMQIGVLNRNEIISVVAAKPYMATTSTSSSSTGSSSTQSKSKPITPSFSLVNFNANKINIEVNIGNNSSDRPDKVYLVAPKLGVNTANPAIGKINGNTASWSIELNKLLSGVMIPLEIVSEKDGIRSETLTGSYQAPEIVEIGKITSPPAAPTGFKSRIAGSSALVTVDIPKKAGATPSKVFLFGSSLGIPKSKAMQGEIVGSKALFEIPIKSSMIGKKYLVTVYLSNSKGESKPLSGTLSIPAISTNTTLPSTLPVPPKTVTKTVICARTNQTRTFSGESCPPGWNKR